MARRRFFVNEVHSGRAQVRGEDAHHLTRVLRVEAGQKYEISDNRAVYVAEVEEARKDLVSFSILERLPAPEPPANISILAALIKFDRFEWMIEKTTELGVTSIVPFMAERSDKGLDRAAVKRIGRWRKIACEASEQSRRARLPEISDPVPFREAIAAPPGVRLALDELAGAPPLLSALPLERAAGANIALLVGPEGGWTDRERSGFQPAGWMPVSLGGTILRAETAAIAAAAVLMAACTVRNNSPQGGI